MTFGRALLQLPQRMSVGFLSRRWDSQPKGAPLHTLKGINSETGTFTALQITSVAGFELRRGLGCLGVDSAGALRGRWRDRSAAHFAAASSAAGSTSSTTEGTSLRTAALL